MSLEETLEEVLEKLKKLELRASNISDIKDDTSKELHISVLLFDYLKVSPRTPLEHYVKMTLLHYLVGMDPFPLRTEERKTKRGSPVKKDISESKIAYYILKTKGSLYKTAKLLNVDRKTVKSKFEHAQTLSEEIKDPDKFPPEKLKFMTEFNDSLFLDEFNADLERHEKNKKSKL